jgi:hypothetical protein
MGPTKDLALNTVWLKRFEFMTGNFFKITQVIGHLTGVI